MRDLLMVVIVTGLLFSVYLFIINLIVCDEETDKNDN